MDYRLLGRTGVRASPLCIGSFNFGFPTRREESLKMQVPERALPSSAPAQTLPLKGLGGQPRTGFVYARCFSAGSMLHLERKSSLPHNLAIDLQLDTV
ncbi:MAG: hypothetical protein HC914_05590 [Chloroflexaceae bacterium]|nr:hypothetical protein [Chloroflexaceae bacterium]